MSQVLWLSSQQNSDTSQPKRLALRWWRNSRQMDRPLKGFIWIVHGLGEHAGRYEPLAHFYNQLDFDVLALDLPGHGLSASEGKFTALADFSSMLKELNAAYDFWVNQGPLSAKQPALSPWYLIGHSMGALLSLYWILNAKREGFAYEFASRALISAPPLALKMQVPAWKSILAKGVFKVLPDLKLSNEISPNMLSYDVANVEAYRKDPLVHPHSSPRNFLSLLETAKEVKARAVDIEIPLCLAVGADDPIVSVAAIEEYYQQLNTHKKLLIVDQAKHEIFNEYNKRALYESSAQWFL